MDDSSTQEPPKWQDDSSGNREFWLYRELAKVKDPKRRNWLKEVAFAGSSGYRKFLRLMETREGALEFKTGEWPKKIPKLTNEQIKARRRKCICGCGALINPRFTPWGELFEEFEPICVSCRKSNKRKNTNMSDNQPTITNPSEASSRIAEALKTIETEKQSLKSDFLNTLAEAKNKLHILLSPSVGFTFEQIFSDAEFKEIVVAFGIRVRGNSASKSKPGPKQIRSKKGDASGLEAPTLTLLKDKTKRNKREIKKALERQGYKVGTRHHYTLLKLEKQGEVKREGKGRATLYKIAA